MEINGIEKVGMTYIVNGMGRIFMASTLLPQITQDYSHKTELVPHYLGKEVLGKEVLGKEEDLIGDGKNGEERGQTNW